MELSSRERIIFIVTVAVAAVSLAYVYVIEPAARSLPVSDAVTARYRSALQLLDRKAEIDRRHQEAFSAKYWKNSLDEQRVSFQECLEGAAHSAGVAEILNITPVETNVAGGRSGVSLRIDTRCQTPALVSFLFKVSTLPVPVRVDKLYIYGDDMSPGDVKSQMVLSMPWIPPGERE